MDLRKAWKAIFYVVSTQEVWIETQRGANDDYYMMAVDGPYKYQHTSKETEEKKQKILINKRLLAYYDTPKIMLAYIAEWFKKVFI